MTVEQLLKPRYKVIADYPGSTIEIGDVLYKHIFPENGNYCYVTNPEILLLGSSMRAGEIENFPHLFRKLHWWEDRKPEEMPEYIKNKDGVFKVDRWEYDGDTEVKNEILCILSDFYGSHLDHYPDNIDALPATETEYNEHLKTLNP